MEFFDLVKRRRSIRKYQDRQIERGDLEKIIQAGLCAPNAGGGQRAIIVAVRNRALCEKIGRLNIAKFNRNSLAGSYVSSEQPSIIDDPSIRSGFYGAPTVCAVFGPKNFLYSVADAFCCAENMAAGRLRNWGLPPVMIAQRQKKPSTTNRGAAAFEGMARSPDGYVATLLRGPWGTVAGTYPAADKPRRDGPQPGSWNKRWSYMDAQTCLKKLRLCGGAESFATVGLGRGRPQARLHQRHPL